jgi:putative membrane protein
MDLLASGSRLLLGSVILRPYVFAFLATYLVVSGRDLGWRRSLLFGGWTFAVAWTAEFLSTRIGIPFGLYHYTGTTRDQELFLSNVPFFDSLSFVFLAYASYCLARIALRRATGPGVVLLAAVAMMLLDVVIDPLAVRGDRWFLGRIFFYPDGGVFYGVPLSNFVGWVVVGALAVGGFVLGSRRPVGSPIAGAGLYYGVLVFNLAVAWWIGEPGVLALGLAAHLSVLLAWWCWYAGGVSGVGLSSSRAEEHRA